MRLSGHLVFILAMLAATSLLLLLSLGLPAETRRAPMVVVIPTIGLLALEALREVRTPAPVPAALGNPSVFVWFAGFVLACQLLDGVVVVSVFLLLSLRFWARAGWPASLGLSGAVFAVLRTSFPNGLAHPPLF